jgi:hypothetical protein
MIVDDYLLDAQNYFGESTTYIESLKAIRGQQTIKKNLSKEEILREAQVVASSSYESNTQWGTEVSVLIHLSKSREIPSK